MTNNLRGSKRNKVFEPKTYMNPVKDLRLQAEYSQRQLALSAGVTEQVVLRAEHGMYPTLPPSILRVLHRVSGLTQAAIEDMYEEWLLAELREVILPNAASTLSVGTTTTPQEFNKWRSTVCRINGVPDSLNSFAKLFKINAYVLQKYEAGKLKQTPIQLIERINYIKREW